MKVESIQAARAAYDIEAQCILEVKDYFDEVAFSRAVHLLGAGPAHRRCGLRAFRHHLPALCAPHVLHRAAGSVYFASRGRPRRDGLFAEG